MTPRELSTDEATHAQQRRRQARRRCETDVAMYAARMRRRHRLDALDLPERRGQLKPPVDSAGS
ncbi:MAG: hypothetical protein WBV82_08325 [Myxococcaceae bacterium]